MKLVTRFEAASRSTAELHDLLREAFNTVASTPLGSPEHDNALASIETIRAEIVCRLRGP